MSDTTNLKQIHGWKVSGGPNETFLIRLLDWMELRNLPNGTAFWYIHGDRNIMNESIRSIISPQFSDRFGILAVPEVPETEDDGALEGLYAD